MKRSPNERLIKKLQKCYKAKNMKYKIKWASILGDRSLINKNKNDKIYVLEYVYV